MTAAQLAFPLRRLLRWAALRAAQRYIAGATVQDALRIEAQLHRRQHHCTLGYWDSADDSPAEVMAQYQAALQAIKETGRPAYLSIKGWAFGFDAARYRRLRAVSTQLGVPLHFDAGPIETAEPTFELLATDRTAAQPLPGCTLPARWRRSLDDANRAAACGGPVRVVKGQWADPHEPEVDINAQYLEIVKRLARGRAVVRIATHDERLAEAALRQLRTTGTHCELELLYGLPGRRLITLAHRFGVPVRLYVPYGHGYLPYGLAAIRRNPRILGWLVRDAILRH